MQEELVMLWEWLGSFPGSTWQTPSQTHPTQDLQIFPAHGLALWMMTTSLELAKASKVHFGRDSAL